jgi:hypothetical protein
VFPSSFPVVIGIPRLSTARVTEFGLQVHGFAPQSARSAGA